MIKSFVASGISVTLILIFYGIISYVLLKSDIFDEEKISSSVAKKFVILAFLYFFSATLGGMISFHILFLSPYYLVNRTYIVLFTLGTTFSLFLTPWIVYFLYKNKDNISIDVICLSKRIVIGLAVFSFFITGIVFYQYRESIFKPATREIHVTKEKKPEKKKEYSYQIVDDFTEDQVNVLEENEKGEDVTFEYTLRTLIVVTPFYEHDDLQQIAERILKDQNIKDSPVFIGFIDDKRDRNRFFATTGYCTYMEGGTESFMGTGQPYKLKVKLKSQSFVGEKDKLKIYYAVEEAYEKLIPTVQMKELTDQEIEMMKEKDDFLEKAYQEVADKYNIKESEVRHIHEEVFRAKMY